MDYRKLRPNVIKKRIQERKISRNIGHDIIRERDDLHRRLNKSYGFSEPDGTFGIGKRDHTNKEYVSKYDEIENKYGKKYSQQYGSGGTKESESLSIWEYLILDNINSEVSQYLLDTAEKHEHESYHDFIKDRACSEIARWRKEYNVGGIMKRIEHEKDDLAYRSARCRRELKVGKFNLSAQKAIFDFNSIYIRNLKDVFESIES